MSEIAPIEVLRQARQFVKSQQYAEALQKYTGEFSASMRDDH